MGTWREAAATAVLVGALAGCASPGFGPSEEFRLRSLEEHALKSQDAEAKREERLRSLEERLSARLAALDNPFASTPAPAPAPRALSETPAADVDRLAAAAAAKPAAKAPAKEPAKPKKTAKAKSKPAEKKGAKGSAKKPAPDSKAGKASAADRAKAAVADWEKPAAAKAEPKAESKADSVAAKGAYDQALAALNKGKPEEARRQFEKFLVEHPSSPLAPNAQYWVGESLYTQKRYADAVLAYRKVQQDHPQHEKAAAALLKIGYAYKRLGDEQNARFYLEALVADYPNTESAALAKKMLASSPKE